MHIFLCDPTLLSCDSYKAICLSVYCVDLVCLISRLFLFLLLSDQLCLHLPRKALETTVVTVTFYDVKVSALLYVEETLSINGRSLTSRLL